MVVISIVTQNDSCKYVHVMNVGYQEGGTGVRMEVMELDFRTRLLLEWGIF